MRKIVDGKTLDQWEFAEPEETWPPEVAVVIANRQRLRAEDKAQRETGEKRGPREAYRQRYEVDRLEQDSQRKAKDAEGREKRLAGIAYRYGTLDALGKPVYDEKAKQNLHHLGLLLLADSALLGDARSAADLVRFTQTTPEMTVHHQIDATSDREQLLDIRVAVWRGMDASAQKAYLARLAPEERVDLVSRAKELQEDSR